MNKLGSKQIMVAACALIIGLCAAGQGGVIYVDDDAAQANEEPFTFRALTPAQRAFTTARADLAIRPRGRIIYVDDDAAGANDGTSWTDAFVHLQEALAVASRGDRIQVAVGQYRPDQGAGIPPGDRDARFHLVSGVTLAGGYAGLAGTDPFERDVERYETILTGDLAGDDAPDFANRGDNSRVVVASLSNDATTVLSGFTITGGSGYSGSGITCLASDLWMERCTVAGNRTISSTGDGAGVYSSGGSLVLRGCVFRDNFTWGSGAGFLGEDGDLTFVDCLFERNEAENKGGGLCARNAILRVERCTFRENEAFEGAGMYAVPGDGSMCVDSLFVGNRANSKGFFEGSGGGARIGGTGSSMVLHRCSFEGNSAPEGGGLCHSGATDNRGNLVLTQCGFYDNRAEWGGALDARQSAFQATDCFFEGNVAGSTGGGGAIHVRDGRGRGDPAPTGQGAQLVRCRFSGNRASGSPGGALYNDNSYTTLRNCLLVGNTGFGGGAVHSRGASPTLMHCTLAQNQGGWVGGLSDEAGGAVLDHCIVWGNDGDELSGAAVVIYSNVEGGWPGEGNIDVEPCFAFLGHWFSGSRSRVATWVDGDYHLKSQAGRWDPVAESWVLDEVTSPCIDAGDPNAPVGEEPFPNGGIVNLGAYGGTSEASKSYFGDPVCETHMAGDINGDCRVDFEDLAIVLAQWSQGNPPEIAP